MRIIITGSRDWTDPEPVLEALNRYARRHDVHVVIADHTDGAERIARDWALSRGSELTVHKVHNNRRSTKTPEARDAAMIRDGADLCLCFIFDTLVLVGTGYLAYMAGIETHTIGIAKCGAN